MDQNEACDYRPVSNLSFLSKILEKAVSRQLDSYLTNAKLFSSHQSAYRKFHSTETVLLRITSDLVSHLDKREVALMAFLDLSATFDTVDKEILLNRLSTTFGIHCRALKWFRSYLTNHTKYILFNGVKSPVRNVMHGIHCCFCYTQRTFTRLQSDLVWRLIFMPMTQRHTYSAHQIHLSLLTASSNMSSQDGRVAPSQSSVVGRQ